MRKISHHSISFARIIGSIVLVGILTCLLALTAFGQTTSGTQGALSGTVTDPGGATVAGATVTLKSNTTGAQRSTTTESQGNFIFAFPAMRHRY